MQDLTGKRVRLKDHHAKWHLDNPDIYARPCGEVDHYYENETLMHLTHCIGVPMEGIVTGRGGEWHTWRVEWKVGSLKCSYYIRRQDFEVLNG